MTSPALREDTHITTVQASARSSKIAQAISPAAFLAVLVWGAIAPFTKYSLETIPTLRYVNNPAPNGSKSPIEQAIERSIELRDRFRDGATQLHDLSLKLKAIQREQKLNAREFHSVRSTLRSLQGFKL